MEAFDPRYRSLDHWRGVAALAVLVFHGFGSARSGNVSVHASIGWLKWIADFGWFGVHLFFVISGYCIAANVYRAARERRSPWYFLRDRFLRIYPVYWGACVASIAINAAASPFNHVPLSKNLPADGFAWFANLLLIEPYVGVEPLLLVSWSLVFELGFYVLVAVGFWLFRAGMKVGWVVHLAVLLGIAGLVGLNQGPFGVLGFWAEFVCGGLVFVALWLRHHLPAKTVWALLAILLFAIVGAWTLPAMERVGQMIGAAGFALLLFFLRPLDHRIAAITSMRWLASVGLISFSLYLVHVPLGLRLVSLGARWIPMDGPGMWLLQFAGWANSLFFGFLFYRLCEAPVERWRRQRQRIRFAAVPLPDVPVGLSRNA